MGYCLKNKSFKILKNKNSMKDNWKTAFYQTVPIRNVFLELWHQYEESLPNIIAVLQMVLSSLHSTPNTYHPWAQYLYDYAFENSG